MWYYEKFLSSCICLSVYLPYCLSPCLSVCLSVCVSFCICHSLSYSNFIALKKSFSYFYHTFLLHILDYIRMCIDLCHLCMFHDHMYLRGIHQCLLIKNKCIYGNWKKFCPSVSICLIVCLLVK